MAEILTESFCERCGTRYTFEAATPKKHRIGRLKVLSKGLKNYVLSDDASLDEALADARSEEERELSGGQLDAFHQTFQFCMSCRQYTCSNCWNEAEGRCLSCAPLSLTGSAQLGSPLDDLLARGGMAPMVDPAALESESGLGSNGATNGHYAADELAAPTGSAWPTIDLFRTAGSAPAVDAAASASEAVAEIVPEAAPRAVPESVAQIVPEAVAEVMPEATAETADEPAAPVDAELSEPSDFWTKPFTGFAPVPEPTNGHSPAAQESEPSLEEPAPAEAAVEVEPALAVETAVGADLAATAVPAVEAEAATAVPAVEAELAAEPPEPLEIEAAAVEPIEASVALEVAEPIAVVEPVESFVEPVEAVEPAVEAVQAVEPVVETVEPVEAQAPEVDPAAEARAMELAERTTRLLGRLRVQPRSAGSAPAPTPADDHALAPAAFQAPEAPQPPQPPATVRPAASWPRLQPQPSRAPVQPAAAPPPPIDQPALIPFDKLVERPAPPAWIQPAAVAAPVEAAPEPVEALTPQANPEPLAEPVAEPVPEAPPTAPVEAAAPAEPAPAAAVPAAATDRVEMPAWPRLTRPPLSDSPAVQAPPMPMPAQAPQWPAPLRPGFDASSTPFWASGENDRVPGELDVWTASAREVAEAPGQVAGVQSCVKCGLSLSATARFCRRCGSRQG